MPMADSIGTSQKMPQRPVGDALTVQYSAVIAIETSSTISRMTGTAVGRTTPL